MKADLGGERAAGIAGLVAVGLLLPATYVVLAAGNLPEPDAPTAKVVAYFAHHRTAYLMGIFFEAASLGLWIWFFGGLRSLLRRATGAESPLPSVAYAAGVVFTVMMIVEDAALAASADLASRSAAGMDALRQFGYLLAWPLARPPLVLALGVVAFVVLRHRALPRPVGLFTLVVAAANAAFLGSIFVRSGPYVSGGSLAHAVGGLSYGLWLLWVSLALATRAAPERVGMVTTDRRDVP